MNEDTSGNVASLQEEIRKLKVLLQQARGIVCSLYPNIQLYLEKHGRFYRLTQLE